MNLNNYKCRITALLLLIVSLCLSYGISQLPQEIKSITVTTKTTHDMVTGITYHTYDTDSDSWAKDTSLANELLIINGLLYLTVGIFSYLSMREVDDC